VARHRPPRRFDLARGQAAAAAFSPYSPKLTLLPTVATPLFDPSVPCGTSF
jgi:hypothetical protein